MAQNAKSWRNALSLIKLNLIGLKPYTSQTMKLPGT